MSTTVPAQAEAPPTGRSAGRVALVTGASRGIGRAICERLAADGAAVAVNYAADRRANDAAAVVATIEGTGGRAIAVQGDVADAAQVERMVQETVAALGPVTILVNNAAITRVHGPWTDIDEAGWDDVMDTNAKGMYLCCRAVHPHMVQAGWGRIVNIASVTFLTGQANLAHYVASKGAMIGFTRSLARSVGPEGITVNSVSPGAITTETELDLTQAPGERERLAADMARLQSVPRRGMPADIAGAVSFLVSDDASFISGQLLNVDGGWAMH